MASSEITDAIYQAIRVYQIQGFVSYLRRGLVASGYLKAYKYPRYEQKRIEKLTKIAILAFEADESWIFSKDGKPKASPERLLIHPETYFNLTK